MKNYLLLALAAVALCFTACKKNTDDPTPSSPVAVTGVSLDKTMVALEIDESTTVTATVAPENATNKNVEWSVADTTIATIENGVVTGVAAGETTLTVTTVDGGHTATIPVKVATEKIPVTGINMTTGSNMEIYEGKQAVCSIDVLPANATDSSVKWSSSNESVATVIPIDGEGDKVVFIKGVSKGTAIITATTNDGGFEASCEVTVTTIKPTAITIDGKTEGTIYTWHGKVLDLNVEATPIDADLRWLDWSFDYPYSEGITYEVTKDKVVVALTAPENTNNNTRCSLTVKDYQTIKAKINIDARTVAWLHEMKNGEITSDYHTFTGMYPGFAYKFNWQYSTPKTLHFIAYYNTNGHTAESVPSTYYADRFIPNTEYTLTSNAPDKLKATVESDGKSWKLERLDTSNLAEVTLTYTCGRHTQTYTINLIP